MEDLTKMARHDSYSTEDDDSLYIASKCWERITDAAVKVRKIFDYSRVEVIYFMT